MLVPLSDNLDKLITERFPENNGAYWLIRVMIDDLVKSSNESGDYFAQLMLNLPEEKILGSYINEQGQTESSYDSELIYTSILGEMKKEKSPLLKAKGFLLGVGYSDLKDLQAMQDSNGDLWCFPCGLKTLNLVNSIEDIKKISYDVILTFPNQVIYLKSLGCGEMLRKRHPPMSY